ncbi:MAG TPA: hypothetical protein DCM32_03490 [Xanthomonadaceae bacterium]|jgi:hypothetical protein|nr:hypothetical protein [Xanthomonadaceae bacterium]
MAQTPTRARASAAGTEARLHAASVRAGAGAAIDVALHTLPLLRPFVPKRLLDAAESMKPAAVRRELVKTVYRRHGLKPARWEVESVLAVAETQAKLGPLTRQDALRDLLGAWLPAPLVRPLLRWTPVQPLIEETARAVATTWAAGRYADAVCRVRKAGMDWLPAPLGDALEIAPTTLRDFSAEALTMALPPLKLAAAWGGEMLRASTRIAKAARHAATETKRPARGRASAKRSG